MENWQTMENKRKNITQFEDSLENAISDNSYTDEKYANISQIIQFMQSETKELKNWSFDKAIFILGPTGAGKSTLINYLENENNLIIDENSLNDTILKAVKSVTEIGREGCSTTLFPTSYFHPHVSGVLLDCAGEGDTGGVIARAILSLIKFVIA